MEVLPVLLLLAAAADIKLHAVRLASKDNGLADASITDSVLTCLPIFKLNQVRHRHNQNPAKYWVSKQ